MLKQELFDRCREILEQRIASAAYAMKQAQESANSNEKSSMGDKYETDRAMSQNARDMNAKQLYNSQQELATLLRIDPSAKLETAVFGALVETADACYLLSVGLGVLEKEPKKMIALSMDSPLASALKGKRAGDTIQFNGRKTEITGVW